MEPEMDGIPQTDMNVRNETVRVPAAKLRAPNRVIACSFSRLRLEE